MEAIGHREAFGLNWDPSHFVWQDLDPVGFIWDFKDRIYHVDCKDAKKQVGNGRNGRMGSHLPWADPRRGWDFVSTGHGDVPWEACFRMLNTIGYDGPISVEWEDAGMDRLVGAPEALAFVRRLAFDPPAARVRRRLLQRQLSRREGSIEPSRRQISGAAPRPAAERGGRRRAGAGGELGAGARRTGRAGRATGLAGVARAAAATGRRGAARGAATGAAATPTTAAAVALGLRLRDGGRLDVGRGRAGQRGDLAGAGLDRRHLGGGCRPAGPACGPRRPGRAWRW